MTWDSTWTLNPPNVPLTYMGVSLSCFGAFMPSSSWIYLKSVPPSSGCVAKLCLRVWTEGAFLTFASLHTFITNLIPPLPSN